MLLSKESTSVFELTVSNFETDQKVNHFQAFMGPNGEIYLPEGTVLEEGEELILDSEDGTGKPIVIQVVPVFHEHILWKEL